MPSCSPDPANYDIPGNNCDDDGDGKIDNVTVCDMGVPADGNAQIFAQSLGICQSATGTKWGIVSAAYANSHAGSDAPADAQHGVLPKFGNVLTPREGSSFGILSSGSATEYDSDNGPQFKGPKDGMQGGLFPSAGPPAGFPKQTQGCPTIATATFDLINVKLVLKVPANAKGLQFDFDFWSGEWPEYVCSDYNDSFIAFLSAKGFNNGAPDNISFDAMKNPVSVNNGFFDRCTAGTQLGCKGGGSAGTSTCLGGPAELAGTGFEDLGTYCGNAQSTGGGATGWLTSTAPVQPGEQITIEFMIWDTGDASFDSSVILDNFKWVPDPVTTGTTRPPVK